MIFFVGGGNEQKGFICIICFNFKNYLKPFKEKKWHLWLYSKVKFVNIKLTMNK